MLLAGLQDAVQSGKWPLCCLAATAYGISTASGETDRHRRVRTAGRRRRTGHLVDLEQSRGPSAGQPKPHWTECVGSAGLPLVWGSKERDARDAEARRLRVEGLSFREIWTPTMPETQLPEPLDHAAEFAGRLPDVILFPIEVRGGDSIRLVPRNRGNTLLLEAPAVQMELARR